jgi:hypothetical protein
MSKGHELFAQYAYPPNELGYCGPSDGAGPSELATHAKDFDGAWPYLTELAKAVGGSDPLDEDTVRSYWIGGPSLDEVNADEMLARLRAVFKGQVSGLLSELPTATGVLAHHSFHGHHRLSALGLGVRHADRRRSHRVVHRDADHARSGQQHPR